MARYEHLPILRQGSGQVYKGAMDLAIHLEKIVRNFSRYNKYTLGSDLRGRSREVVGVIIRANPRMDKRPVPSDLRERLEALQVLLRIGKEARAFQDFKAHGAALPRS